MTSRRTGRTVVVVTTQHRVATVLLDGAQVLNALHSDTHRELHRAIDVLDGDDSVGAIVVRGAGRAFCSGSDLREIGRIQGDDAKRYVSLDFRTKNRIAGCTKPVVAAIQGHCVGGGMELALACDIRIAAEDATFSLPEVSLGSIPGSGGLQRLPEVVGRGVAKDLVLTGRKIGAHEAYQWGLVTRLTSPDRLEAEAQLLAHRLAHQSATAMQLAKAALDPAPEPDRGLVATYQMLAGGACHSDPGYHEATSRYTAKETS